MSINYILMIQTKDRKKYFTAVDNLQILLEFARTFDIELSIVEANGVVPLKLEELASAMCDESYRPPNQDCKIKLIQRVHPKGNIHGKNRRLIMENARLIRRFIRERLENGCIITVRELKSRFCDLGVSDSCISNHVSAVRREMTKSGLDVAKIKSGSYKLR